MFSEGNRKKRVEDEQGKTGNRQRETGGKKGKSGTMRLTMAAFCVTLNFVGAYIALCLKLPVYLDSIGTILAGAVLGPMQG